jgi:DHA2 family multidrug resistance protein
MLDEGRDQDWFASPQICMLAAIAIFAFLSFLIWVLTENHPIVDLRIFRHRGFAAVCATYMFGFGAFFAVIVIIPLWLQQNMGYTATNAGYATGIMGILAVLSGPLIAKAVEKFDPRLIIAIGLIGMGGLNAYRTSFNSNVTFLQLAIPTLLYGPFLVMFFVPLNGLALSTVDPDEQANAAGLSNFLRTIGGAFATSLVQTSWSDAGRRAQSELAGAMVHASATLHDLRSTGMAPQVALGTLSRMVENQSVMLATLQTFGIVAIVFFLSAAIVWIVPKPIGPIAMDGGH